VALHYWEDVGVELGGGDQYGSECPIGIRTPASTNGLLNHSFHQNCLSTLLHSGRVGYGSASGSTLSEGSSPPSLPLKGLGLAGPSGLGGRVWLLLGFGLRDRGGEESGRALREAKSAFCFWDLATCACLCCNDLVISGPHTKQDNQSPQSIS
jgi:hypothetical protein